MHNWEWDRFVCFDLFVLICLVVCEFLFVFDLFGGL